MTRVGKYDPASSENSSSLWVYGEVPVSSAKLNSWNGNIDAGFWLLHRILNLLADDAGGPYLVGAEGSEPFLVEEQTTPDLTVQVRTGFALGPTYLLGASDAETLPESGTFTAPTSDPRIDSIGIRESGEWVIETGTESATPTPPTLDADVIHLADVYLRVGAVSIKNSDDSSNAYLIDKRPRKISSIAHRHSQLVSPAETPDGVRNDFSTADRFVMGTLHVYVNGLRQAPGVHYTEDSDLLGYTFTQAPPTGFAIHHEYEVG